MNAFNKEQTIAEIKLAFKRLKMSHIVSLMDKYGLPSVLKVGSFHDIYLPKRLEAASMHQLAALNAALQSQYLVGGALDEKYGLPSEEEIFKLFISHAVSQEEEALALKEQFAYGGIDCFVAGEDIAANTEWLVEIVTELEAMDGLLSLITDRSIESVTCNQEVGFALGAGKPVVSVMNEQAPLGLIGAMQAVERKEGMSDKDVALEVIDALMKLPLWGPRLTNLFVRRLVSYESPSDSFKVIGFCRKALAFSNHLTAGQIFELRKAARENDQIARFASGRGPELIESLCVDFETKLAVG